MKMKELKINKIQKYINIGIILFFSVAFVYFILIKIISLFKKTDPLVYSELVNKFSSETVVKDYNTFFTIEGILNQFIEKCLNEEYSKLHDIIIDEYKKNYSLSKTKEIIKDYNENHFFEAGYENYYDEIDRLKEVYLINNLYIIVFNDINGEEMYLAVKMDNSTYKFTFIETE